MDRLTYFLRRLAAFIIDQIILLLILLLPTTFVMIMAGFIIPQAPEYISYLILIINSLWFIVAWLYSACFECSSLQGTLGKAFAKIQVVNPEGNRLHFKNTTARFLARSYIHYAFFLISFPNVKDVSALNYVFLLCLILSCIDNFFIFFMPKHQALHDLLTKTLVVSK